MLQHILANLLATAKTHPDQLPTLLANALGIISAAPTLAIGLLPAGPVRVWAEGHPAETVAVLTTEVTELGKHPGLLQALAQQYAPK